MNRVRDILPSVFVAISIVLGGASNGGWLANTVVQLLAVMAIVLVSTTTPLALIRSERLLLRIGALFLLIGVAQLVPLPAFVWSHLAGRGEVVRAFALVGKPLPMMPLSLWPMATFQSLTALLPPLAAVLLVATTGPMGLRYLAGTIAAIAALSFFVGLSQLAGGPTSALYFYENTNRGETVGFFANSNHLATLGVMTLPFIAALGASDVEGRKGLHRRAGKWMALACVAAFIVIGILADGSLAGFGLLVPALVGSFLILRAERARVAVPVMAALAGVVAVAFTLLALNSPLTSGIVSSDVTMGTQSRFDIYSHTLKAIGSVFPWGSGLGSFLLMYPLFDQDGAVTPVFVNHAHNDYLELLLETGIFGVILLALFVLWYLRRALFAWRDAGNRARFAKAASISAGLLMIHSLVDYPIRTAAIAVLFAACCAMMAKPLPEAQANLFRTPRRSGGSRGAEPEESRKIAL